MAITLTIDGVSRDVGYLVYGTEQIRRTVKGKATASFTLRASTAILTSASIGAAVVLSDGTLTFKGTIDSLGVREEFEHDRSHLIFDVQCVDNNPFDRRIVSRRYPAGSIWKNIVIDIVTNFLDGENVTTTNVDGFGAIQDALEFDYRTARECFNTLTEVSGEDWWAVPNGSNLDLYFKAPGAPRAAAAFDLTSTSGNWVDPQFKYDRSTSYRNRQFLRTKVATVAGTITETHYGDGVLYFFPTQFTMSEAPTVTVGGVSQTIYSIDNGDAAGQNGWYWIVGGAGITHGQGTAPGSGVAVVITYGGYDSSVVMVQDSVAITARAAVEGGSGKWDMLDEARDIDNVDIATQIANGMLNRRGTLPVTITYRTKTSGLEIGAQQNVNITKFGINADYYITDIESRAVEAPRATQFFWHTVTLSLLLDRSHWTKWWHEWYSRTKGGRVGRGLGGDTSAGGGNGGEWIHEVPSGTMNGSNASFTLTYVPSPHAIVLLFVNGILQTRFGINSSPPTYDYTISGKTITYTDAPLATDWHEVFYMRGAGSSSLSRARSFAGGTNRISWGNDAAHLITGNLSIGMWISLPSTATGILMLRGKVATTTTQNTIYALVVQGASNAWDIRYFHDYAPGGASDLELHDFNTNIPNDTWTYIGISRDTTAKTVSLYTGTSAGSMRLIETWSYTTNPAGGSDSSCELQIGNQPGGSGGYGDDPLVGKVEQHYVAGAVWSLADHIAAMNGTPPPTGLVLSARMGTSPETDASSSALSGTVTGTTLVQGH